LTQEGAVGVAIRRIEEGDIDLVLAAGHLFDGAPIREATARFLGSPGHHLLMAFEDGRALGFISGIELTHPDKGVEMFLYELGVDEEARGRGIGSALTAALRGRAQERGCYGMWVLTEVDNEAALATYRRAGAGAPSTQLLLEWRFPR
jgi:ribosomal protein S18 acetylase RimI-like enzyme